MKEVVVTGPFRYEAREAPMPEISGPLDVLVRMKAAGVCGSDHHIYHGTNPNTVYPRILGHENAAVVESTGSAVTAVKPGDHVVIDLVVSCGVCRQCRAGRRNVCENVKVRGSSVDGGFREFLVVPESALYVVPDRVPFSDAALVEPFAVGAHCTARGRVASDDIVFVLGAGTIGSIILQTCKLKGARVIVCDVAEDSLARAERYGADLTVDARTENPVERAREFTGGKGVTVAFDSACYPGSLASLLAPGLVQNAGRVVSLGFVTEREPISQAMINSRELDLIGSRMSCGQFAGVVDRMARGEYNLEGLATTFIEFDDVDRMFRYMEKPEPGVKKMVLTFG